LQKILEQRVISGINKPTPEEIPEDAPYYLTRMMSWCTERQLEDRPTFNVMLQLQHTCFGSDYLIFEQIGIACQLKRG